MGRLFVLTDPRVGLFSDEEVSWIRHPKNRLNRPPLYSRGSAAKGRG
jgi:hypothetical protein